MSITFLGIEGINKKIPNLLFTNGTTSVKIPVDHSTASLIAMHLSKITSVPSLPVEHEEDVVIQSE